MLFFYETSIHITVQSLSDLCGRVCAEKGAKPQHNYPIYSVTFMFLVTHVLSNLFFLLDNFQLTEVLDYFDGLPWRNYNLTNLVLPEEIGFK